MTTRRYRKWERPATATPSPLTLLADEERAGRWRLFYRLRVAATLLLVAAIIITALFVARWSALVIIQPLWWTGIVLLWQPWQRPAAGEYERGQPYEGDAELRREYASSAEAQADADWLREIGFVQREAIVRPQVVGIGRLLLIGAFGLLWRPGPHVVVTYERR